MSENITRAVSNIKVCFSSFSHYFLFINLIQFQAQLGTWMQNENTARPGCRSGKGWPQRSSVYLGDQAKLVLEIWIVFSLSSIQYLLLNCRLLLKVIINLRESQTQHTPYCYKNVMRLNSNILNLKNFQV